VPGHDSGGKDCRKFIFRKIGIQPVGRVKRPPHPAILVMLRLPPGGDQSNPVDPYRKFLANSWPSRNQACYQLKLLGPLCWSYLRRICV
jgi:hypothetical protein